MDNKSLWTMVEKTNPHHTKEVNLGRRFTAIDAHYQIMRATEVFGPCGQGWGIRNSQYQVLALDANDPHYSLLQFTAQLWYRWEGQEGSYDIAGDIELFEDTRNGWKRVEDSHKKVRTDAVTKGLSWLGFNADVFLNKFADNKYVQRLKNEYDQAQPAAAPAQPSKTVDLPIMDIKQAKSRLWKLAQANGMNQAELAVFCEAQLQVKPEALTIEQAQQLIDKLGVAA